jgi:hypothetical protein
MPSTSRARAPLGALLLAAAIAAGLPGRAAAQSVTRGFAVERLQLAPAGSGWVALDDLRQEGLGGAVSLAASYAGEPLVVRGGGARIAVVRGQAFADLGLAVTWERLRVHAHLPSPLYGGGDSGAVAGTRFGAPRVSLEQEPDTISDAEVGADVRVLGDAASALRLGASARLLVPSGFRSSYDSDGTARGVALVQLAGDAGRLEYAAHAGVHLRPLDQPAVPDAPRGSELLVAAAAGVRVPLGARILVVGPEVLGASALRSLLAADATALEALLAARWEGADSPVRVKLGAGAGLHARFGAPEWRVVAAVELRGRR